MIRIASVRSLVGLVALPAAGQSATVALTAPSTFVSAGERVTVSLVADFDGGGAGPGVFGPAGLYGFGGSISTSESSDLEATGSAVSVSPLLPLGVAAEALNSGFELVRTAGGRTLADGALGFAPQPLAMFELQIDANASEGDSITLSFAGAVVLALADDLSTYSTSPGINQQQLGSASLTLTIGGGRLCADVNNDDAVNSSDFFAWVTAFGAEDLVPCDVNSDGSCTSSDFFAWVTFFGNPLADPGNCPPIS